MARLPPPLRSVTCGGARLSYLTPLIVTTIVEWNPIPLPDCSKAGPRRCSAIVLGSAKGRARAALASASSKLLASLSPSRSKRLDLVTLFRATETFGQNRPIGTATKFLLAPTPTPRPANPRRWRTFSEAYPWSWSPSTFGRLCGAPGLKAMGTLIIGKFPCIANQIALPPSRIGRLPPAPAPRLSGSCPRCLHRTNR